MHAFPPVPEQSASEIAIAVGGSVGVVLWNSLILLWLAWRVRKGETICGWNALIWFGFLCVSCGVVFAAAVCAMPASLIPAIPLAIGSMYVFWLGAEFAPGKQPNVWTPALNILFTGGLLLLACYFHRGKGHASSNESRCRDNLRKIGRAFEYADGEGAMPKPESGSPPVSWRFLLLPYLLEESGEPIYDAAATWDANQNLRAARYRVNTYICPSNPHAQDSLGRWYSAYAMVTGPETFGSGSVRSLKDISEGRHETLLVVEACGLQIVWTEPRDSDFGTLPIGINLPGNERGRSNGTISCYHGRHGCSALMADGSVKTIANNIDPTLLKKMSTINVESEIPTK